MTNANETPQSCPMPFDNGSTGICETCHDCTIEIGASSIAMYGRHSFLLYTFYENGEEKKIFYRYGPDGDDPYPADSSKTDKHGEPIWNHNRNYVVVRNNKEPLSFWTTEHSLWGRIRGVYGEWEGSYEQAAWQDLGDPLLILAKGPQWCNKHRQLVNIMRRIVEKGRYYRPIDLNCNSGTNTMLRQFGLFFKEPGSGWYPASDIDILK